MRGNTTFANASGYTRRAPGIRVYQAPGNTIDGNVSHDNEDSGIECYPGANNSLIYNNVSYLNGDHGIDDYGCTGNRILGNSVYKNVTAGINVEGNSTGATVANNISVDNGLKSPRTHSDIRIEHGSTAGTTVDNDLVYLTTADTLLIWDSVSYSTLAAFQAASGQEAHGIAADPRWVSMSGADFHLRAGSPAIDSGNSVVSGWPNTGPRGAGAGRRPCHAQHGSGSSPLRRPRRVRVPALGLRLAAGCGVDGVAVVGDGAVGCDCGCVWFVGYGCDADRDVLV